MSLSEKESTARPVDRLQMALEIYGRVMAGVMMGLGLRQWAVILGIIDGRTGPFETMSVPWQMATMHLAVVELVACVGLWQRVAWGNVVWFYTALSVIAMHTVFSSTFGSDLAAVAFHATTVAAYILLFFIERYEQRN
jgi:hypothetical protein